MDELRKHIRFCDFGRVECKEICNFPADLKDISISGMKVDFHSDIELNMNDEYEVTVRLSKFNGEPITLLVIPMWRFDDNSKDVTDVQVGFSILPSLDFSKLKEYISKLDENDTVVEIDCDDDNNSQMKLQIVSNDFFESENYEQEESVCQFL